MSDTSEAPPRSAPKRNPRRRKKINLNRHLFRSQSDCEFLSNDEDELPADSKPFPPTPILRRWPLPSNPHVQIAMYVAMAHAGLALLYFVTKLLEGYWRPIQWAILCSMPLRGLHQALVSFWSDSLNHGLFETLIAVPVAALRAATASIADSQSAFLGLLRQSENHRSREKDGFSKLVQWLISFPLFVIMYENVGLVSLPIFSLVWFLVYFTNCRNIIEPRVTKSFSAISSFRRGGRKLLKKSSLCRKISSFITRLMLDRLKTTVGIGLIMFMIMGSIFALFFLSYKITMEGKDAVMSLKTHLNENNYAERIGLKKFMDDNHVPQLIDDYMMKFYESVSQNLDSLAAYYNVTEILDGVKHYLIISPLRSRDPVSSTSSSSSVSQGVINFNLPLSKKLNRIQSKVKNREWRVIYRDVDGVFREFISLITREDLIEKLKSLFLQSLNIPRRLLAGGTEVLSGGVNFLFFMAVSIVSGAAGLLNFISGLMVSLWLLYYLITTESGGVMDHVLGMLPLSRFTRARCAHVLDQAVSSVLLAAAKVTFFEGCLTYILFRFYRIHILYMSTFLAITSAVLPITPAWLSLIPAAAQLAMEMRYVEAILLTAVHQVVLEYGTTAIQDEIPGQNAYLTGLSILGGIALFSSIVEGAIMGPLLMTVMIALKNLYVEFVLSSADENDLQAPLIQVKKINNEFKIQSL